MSTIPPDSINRKALFDRLEYNAKARGFEYLSLYSDSGEFEAIYGNGLSVDDPEPFQNSLKNGESKVAIGTDNLGNKVILLGVPSTYHMTDGSLSAAIVAGFSVDRKSVV